MMRSLPGERALLAERKLHGPTVALFAIMTFVTMVVACAGLALGHVAASVAQGVHERFVIELPAAIAGDMPKALAAARGDPAVSRAEPIPDAELRSTLQRWLGDAASTADLPVPALITVELRPGASVDSLRARLLGRVPGAVIVAEAAELRPLLDTIAALEWLSLTLVLLILLATASAVTLAARGALDTHRPTIEIMHGIGATDRQLTRLFERKIALDALAGAVAGGTIAALGLVLAGSTGEMLAGGFLGASPLGFADGLILAALPLLLVGIATLVARWAVLKALRETL